MAGVTGVAGVTGLTGNLVNPLGISKISNMFSMGSKFNSIFGIIINIIYRYIFEIIIIISLGDSIYSYFMNIDSTYLKIGLISIDFTIILIVLCYIFHKYTLLNKLIVVPPVIPT